MEGGEAVLLRRVKGALTLRREVYAEVVGDDGFTATAWLLVTLIGFVNQLSSYASEDVMVWLGRSVLGTVSVVVGFTVAASVISWAGRTVFGSGVKFRGLVRALGLAYVWHLVGVMGAVGVSSGLVWLAVVGRAASEVLGLVAWFTAAREALGLRWGQTVATVLVGWVLLLLMVSGTGLLFLGMNVAMSGGLFGL
jgi:hypothetical protein